VQRTCTLLGRAQMGADVDIHCVASGGAASSGATPADPWPRRECGGPGRDGSPLIWPLGSISGSCLSTAPAVQAFPTGPPVLAPSQLFPQGNSPDVTPQLAHRKRKGLLVGDRTFTTAGPRKMKRRLMGDAQNCPETVQNCIESDLGPDFIGTLVPNLGSGERRQHATRSRLAILGWNRVS
jgi:hypothetical protein